jgi:hypothetical protein
MSQPDLQRLVEGSGFIFRGRAVPERAAEVRLPAGTPQKAVAVLVDEILLSTEVLSRLVGKEVIVIGEGEAVMENGQALLFFTNCVALGQQVVVQGAGYTAWSPDATRQVAQLVKAIGERPLLERVASAAMIVTGTVKSSAPAGVPSAPRSRHDPDWWIGRVQVQSVIKGAAGEAEIEVLFANSTDIAWYKAPKLREEWSGVLILQHLGARKAPPEVARPIYQIVDPVDALPIERLPDVRRALDLTKGGH